MHRILAGIGAALAAACILASPTAMAAPPAATAFGRLPDIQTAAVSPDGTRIAMLGGPPQARDLTISTIDSAKPVVAPIGDVEVKTLQWASDQYILLRTSVFDKGRFEGTNRAYAYHFDRDVVIDTSGKVLGRLLSNSEASKLALSLPVGAAGGGGP